MYTPPIVTVDGLLFRFKDGRLEILLIKRKSEPFKNSKALPGGYVSQGQTTTEALAAVLRKKTGLDIDELAYLEQLFTFDMIGRDPRGHAVSISYYGILRNPKLKSPPTAESPEFYPVYALPELAFDHKEIVDYAIQRLRSKLTYTNVALAFMPAKFTLSQLQSLYEGILGRDIDKRNFRKQIKAQNLVTETEEWLREGRHRPARLYKFRDKQIKTISF
jgi:8-oxo-dGTP diphosphatase